MRRAKAFEPIALLTGALVTLVFCHALHWINEAVSPVCVMTETSCRFR
jgi:hypothetical protein